MNADIERMAPNMKAMDKWVAQHQYNDWTFYLMTARLDDIESKLMDTEKEADKARKDSKSARDQFNDLKKRRWVSLGKIL